MAYITIQNKVSLLNKYIQHNILQNKGKKEHVGIPENEIFTMIIDNLKEFDESQTQAPKDSLWPVIDSLRVYQEKQSDLRFQINTLMNTLEAVRNEESEAVSLDEIIERLKTLEES